MRSFYQPPFFESNDYLRSRFSSENKQQAQFLLFQGQNLVSKTPSAVFFSTKHWLHPKCPPKIPSFCWGRIFTRWCLNQPSWSICSSNCIISPKDRGLKIKHLWNQHLEIQLSKIFPQKKIWYWPNAAPCESRAIRSHRLTPTKDII